MASSIEQSAARLRIAVFVVIAVLLSAYVSARMNIGLGATHVEYHPAGGDSGTAHSLGTVSVVLLALALGRLTQMLAAIAAGELFSITVIGRFRAFAFWLLLSALCSLLAPIASQLLAASTATGHRFRLIVDFREIITVGTTLLLFLLARLLERARDIESENREII